MKTTGRTEHTERRTTDFNGAAVTEDFLATNDLAFVQVKGKSTKDISFVEGVEAVKNVVQAVVNTARGELKLNVKRGIPYFESLFGKKSSDDLADWSGAMQQAIRNTNGVRSVGSFSYEVSTDGKGRRGLSYEAKLITAYGQAAISDVWVSVR